MCIARFAQTYLYWRKSENIWSNTPEVSHHQNHLCCLGSRLTNEFTSCFKLPATKSGFAVSFKAIRFTLTSITDGQIDVHIIPAPDLNMTDSWTQRTVLYSAGHWTGCWKGPNKDRYIAAVRI